MKSSTPDTGNDREVRVVLVTAPDQEVAAGLARTLVEERLAACGNVLPGIRSIYRWEGEVQDDAEALLVLKTRADRLDELMERASELHPYDVPEILALPVREGLPSYVEWVVRECAASPAR